ncbi:MAG: CRISPR system precrRNA processing endoribonuclease RAMP protein Cas6 [Gammaproteobacteria bacterium]
MPLPEPLASSIENRHPFLAAFRCARFRFRLLAVSHVELPAEKGSTFHGALGHVLKRQAPLSYRFLYEPKSAELAPGLASQRDLPRPFALLPPIETTREYPEGSEISLELTFFGHAIGQFSVCLAALATLGSIGLGRNRGRFEVAEVEAILPDGDRRIVYLGDTQRFADNPAGVCGATIAASCRAQPGSDLTEHLTTRLRLKDHDHLVRRAPRFPIVMQRLLERAECLGLLYHRDATLDGETKRDLVDRARAIETTSHDLHWDDWSRYSGRQDTWMKFGGLLGEITYRGDLTPFLPWLALGEWMHIGGKTSFGLGRYTIEPRREG